MLEVGFTATCTTMSCPVEMPPRIPPALFVTNPSGVISSECSVPFCVTAVKPAPISTPFTALMLIMLYARSASSLSYTGSPQPTGTPEATVVIFAPTESPDLRSLSMNSSSCAT
jgi:hypothetical protein